MGLWESLIRFWGGIAGGGQFRKVPQVVPRDPKESVPAMVATYQTLWRMYKSNALYAELEEILHREGLWKEHLKPLRNPANRIVEFHASKMWPGSDLTEAMPLVDVDRNVERAIRQFWDWSNMGAKKSVYPRTNAAYGDLFLKVTGRILPDRKVWMQSIKPEYVSELRHDERGYLVFIRIDVPTTREDSIGEEKAVWETEIWDKDADSFRFWVHDKGPEAKIPDLGPPDRRLSLRDDMGIDFVPISHGMFKDTDEDRGDSAYGHAFDKIVEVDRVATKLHSLAFRHSDVTIALSANGVDANMMPLPAPEVEAEGPDAAFDLGDGTMMLGEDRVVKLPGNAKMDFLVPNLPYTQLLNILQDQMGELGRDCPEIAYYHILEQGPQTSGRGMRILLSPAIDRGIEFRGNLEHALIRADMMGLTIGQRIGAFPGLEGSFDAGSWKHAFKKRDYLPIDDLEEAQGELMRAQAKQAKGTIGVPDRVLQKEFGYTPAELAENERLMEEQRQAAIERSQQQQEFAKKEAQSGDPRPGRNGSNGQGSTSR